MEYIKNTNIPLVLFVLLALRSLHAFDFAQALALICVSAIFAYHKYLENKKIKDLDADVREELEKIKNVVSGLSVKTGLKGLTPSNLGEKKSYF